MIKVDDAFFLVFLGNKLECLNVTAEEDKRKRAGFNFLENFIDQTFPTRIYYHLISQSTKA